MVISRIPEEEAADDAVRGECLANVIQGKECCAKASNAGHGSLCCGHKYGVAI